MYIYLYIHPIESIYVSIVACRKNVYDSVDEYYVVVKEKGERELEESKEEIRRKASKLEAVVHDMCSIIF